jgi:hypothetical protein
MEQDLREGAEKEKAAEAREVLAGLLTIANGAP